MAFIGLRYVAVAKLATHTDGSAPTYSAGKVLGKAINADLNITRANNPLYADDAIAEEDNGITGMTIDFGLDDVSEEVQAYVGLCKELTSGTGTATVYTYRETSAPADDVGTGYIRVRQMNNVISYQGIWIYSVKYSLNSESARTKGENVEWQTPTMNGTAKGLYIDSSGELTFRDKRNFDTFDAAKAWVNGLAGIT